MNVSFNGFGENVVTFEVQGTVNAGDPVMVTSSGKVAAASGSFCGVCVNVRNGYAAVQIRGYMRFPYTTAPQAGYAKLSALGGKVSADADGREYLVLDVDSAAGTFGMIL